MPTFIDVPTTHAFYTEIEWVAAQGILRGWSSGYFRPGSTMTRYAMAAAMYRIAGEPHFTAPAVSEFTDVRVGQDFYKEIHWVKDRGLLNGWADGTFRPNNNILRDQMAALLYRAAGSPAFTAPTTSPFADVSPKRGFYQQICWLASTGISGGWNLSNGTKVFRPDSAADRGQVSTFIYRFDRAV